MPGLTQSLLRARRLLVRLQRKWVDWTGTSGQVYFQHRVAEYRELWRAAAESIGATFVPLAEDLWEVRAGEVRVRLHNHETEFDNPAVLALSGAKPAVHKLLGAAGLPIPEHAVFSLATIETAEQFAANHAAGCVVKPANGYGGQGVTTHVQGTAEVRRAAVLASVYDGELLVEAQVPGESYRLLVIEGVVVDAVRRSGPRVTGDGTSPVRRLVDDENVRRAQGGLAPLDLDRDCLFTLKYQQLSPDAVPARGRSVLVKSVNDARRGVEVRTVYNETVMDRVCESIRRDAEAAARIVGSDFLGVDLILTDPSVPLRASGGVINEVNTTPALHHHYDVSRQRFPDAARLVLEALVRRRRAAGTARA